MTMVQTEMLDARRIAMLGLAGALGLALAGPAFAKVPARAAQMPVETRGIWMEDSAAGKRQCRGYLAELRIHPAEANSRLVGSEVITARGLHSYAEYGEGNFYSAERVDAVGKGKWRVSGLLGIDGPPEPATADAAVLTIVLAGGKLTYRLVSLGGKPVNQTSASRYFRCADAPTGF